MDVAEGELKKLYVERDGRLVEADRQRARVCFLPKAIGRSKKGLAYRYLATGKVVDSSSGRGYGGWACGAAPEGVRNAGLVIHL